MLLLPEIIQGLGTYYNHLELYNLLVSCLRDRDYPMLRRHFLLMPGVLDVLPTTQSIDQPVMMDRIEYQGQSCLLLAATDAHMTLMIDLMLRYESDSGCNVNRSTLLMRALPVIIADEDIDTKTKPR